MNVVGGNFALQAVQTETEGHGVQEWFTASELADLALPGLPIDKRSINRRAREENWQMRSSAVGDALSRPRIGRGGGIEFHISLLPGTAQIALAERGIAPALTQPAPTQTTSEGAWRWYDTQNAKVKAEAEFRANIVAKIELLEAAGMTRTAAMSEASREHGIATSTLWSWMNLVRGTAASDRLPALAPRRQGGGRQADVHPALWAMFVGDYLRASRPTLKSCYDRTADKAAEMGLSLPSEKTLKRKLENEIPRSVIINRREGPEALRRSIPATRRTIEHLHALEIVNIDGHKFDNEVIPPDGGDPVRPIMVAIQDIYSSKILAWKLDLSENAIQTQLVFRDLFENYGIPKAVLLDNGRAFASKKISGGAPTRFRFKIKEDEPVGVLVALDINPVWALPYRGQSKPIERAFRDMADRIARHPAMEGAYTGNSIANKPHNKGSRAIEWDEFTAHVERGIKRHNAQLGRRGRHYAGRSFDDVFAASYATAPIRKATPEQLRMALLTAQPRRINADTSELEMFGNRYWCEAMHALAGQKVMVRFDPQDLHSEVYLYDLERRFLMVAPLLTDFGFNKEAGAVAAAKRVANFRKRTRELEEMEQILEAEAVAAMQVDAPEFITPQPGAIRLVHGRGGAVRKAVVEPQLPEPKSEVISIMGRLRPDD